MNHPRFEGDTEEDKRRSAYLAILGPGASNVRGIMKKANCRLHLRGVGAPGSKEPEPLHLVVNCKVGDGDLVSQEQQELVKRAVDDIVENGKLPDAIEVHKSIPKPLPDRNRSPSRRARSASYRGNRNARSRSRSDRSRRKGQGGNRRRKGRRRGSEPREERDERDRDPWNLGLICDRWARNQLLIVI